MDKYQYKCILLNDPSAHLEDVQERLSEQGDKGWELINIVPGKHALCGVFGRKVDHLSEISTEPADPEGRALAQAVYDEVDSQLQGRLRTAREEGKWDGTLTQLLEIEVGTRPLKGIGKARRDALFAAINRYVPPVIWKKARRTE